MKAGQGYTKVYRKAHPRSTFDGYVREHIVVWEETNKACVLRWGEVHHINGIRDDNRPQNLQAMMKGHHTIITHKGRKLSEESRQKISDTMRSNSKNWPRLRDRSN